MALARSVIKAIYGTTVIRPRVRVRKQPYFNLRDIKKHIYGLVGYLKMKYLASQIVGSETEDKNGKRHEVVLRERLEVSENEIIDLLDDAFAPSFVQRGEHATVDYKKTRRIARDLLVDVGSGQTGAPR
jgi:hypothetical protein